MLILFRKPWARFCLRLLFCAVVSDIVLLLAFFGIGGYYKLKSKYVKRKTIWKQGFDIILPFWYSVLHERMSMKKGVDFIGVGVGAVIINHEGKVFLAKRGKEARNETGKWEFPGGSVEFGETLEHAIMRELIEEYGMMIEVQELLDVVDHIIPTENQHWISPTYLCRVKNGTPHIREPHKCDQIGWFTLDQIPVDGLRSHQRRVLNVCRRNFKRCNSERDTPVF